ncbi:unnamed protein product, partial [marine sediment metagenome]
MDKDIFLTKIAKLYLEILSAGKSNVICEDSLDQTSYRTQAKKLIKNNKFDYIFTNPPFGAKIPIDNDDTLGLYELGHAWKNIGGSKWEMQSKLAKRQPPQVLFIERCVQLLNEGGKLGIVLPEGIFGNPSDRYIWEYLKSYGKILGIVSLDQNTFQPYTCNKTSILLFQKLKDVPKDYRIDFAIVDNVGHDKDGKVLHELNKDGSKKLDAEGVPIINDDLLDLHFKLRECEDFNYEKEQDVFKMKYSDIKSNIFIPYYYTGVEKTLKKLADDKNFALFSFKDLVDKDIVFVNKNGYIPR